MTGLDPRQSLVQRVQQTHANAKFEVSQLLYAQLLRAQLLRATNHYVYYASAGLALAAL